MSKTVRRLLSTATLILVLALPAAASAHVGLRGVASSSGSRGPSTVRAPARVAAGTQVTPEGGPARVAATSQADQQSLHSGVAATSHAAPQGFHWRDAALGAAAGLTVSIVLGLGIEARRRRSQHPVAS